MVFTIIALMVFFKEAPSVSISYCSDKKYHIVYVCFVARPCVLKHLIAGVILYMYTYIKV